MNRNLHDIGRDEFDSFTTEEKLKIFADAVYDTIQDLEAKINEQRQTIKCLSSLAVKHNQRLDKIDCERSNLN